MLPTKIANLQIYMLSTEEDKCYLLKMANSQI